VASRAHASLRGWLDCRDFVACELLAQDNPCRSYLESAAQLEALLGAARELDRAAQDQGKHIESRANTGKRVDLLPSEATEGWSAEGEKTLTYRRFPRWSQPGSNR